MSEWGPWIEHDGKGCPAEVYGGTYVRVGYRDGHEQEGRAPQDAKSRLNWIWPKVIGDPENDIIRYRIRKPRGLTILENLIADLPAPVGKVDA